ncbi:MAG: uroporphyrinogen decarboxylase family protein [Chloroflexota bacterium]|nr:uroporphyrinogen decarboxylase family protein [Chloroflexota bacterium]
MGNSNIAISNRERFLGICRFERPGDLSLMAPLINDFWMETPAEWVKQGAPEEILDSRFRRAYFQFDHMRELREIQTGLYIDKRLDIQGASYVYAIPPILPSYEPKFLEEDEHTVILINEGGQKVRVFKNDPQKMPMYLDHPVKDRKAWEEYKKRLEPHSPERFPADWDAYVQKMNGKDEPTMLHVGSFFGFLREWMGLERLLLMFYDDPNLIEDMMEQVCYLETECIKVALKDIRVDGAMFWEDMAFKTGPLISPAMFRKFMMPRYKKVTELLRSYGIDIIFVDSDGNLNQLIPLWIESGINFCWPLESAAGNDAVALRKKYGRDMILGGNIDKRALLKGEDAIRQEVMSKVPFLLESGGYFPSVDHLVPPDVTFESYRYFINTLREVAGLEKLPE